MSLAGAFLGKSLLLSFSRQGVSKLKEVEAGLLGITEDPKPGRRSQATQTYLGRYYAEAKILTLLHALFVSFSERTQRHDRSQGQYRVDLEISESMPRKVSRSCSHTYTSVNFRSFFNCSSLVLTILTVPIKLRCDGAR